MRLAVNDVTSMSVCDVAWIMSVFVNVDVGVEKGKYLLKNKLWKCCMSDEDESASAFVMQ